MHDSPGYSGAWHAYLEGLEETLEEVDQCLVEARELYRNFDAKVQA